MIRCTKCARPLGHASFNTNEFTPCPKCNALVRAEVFPAIFRELPVGASGDLLLVNHEASCFYHPNKQAIIPCSSCGRFLCALCDVEFNGEHLCTSCLEAGQKKKKINNLENHRILYDSIAISMAIFPILIWPFTIISAPVTLFIVLRYWKAPSSIVRRTKIRMILAFIIALLQLMGWGFLFFG